MKKEITSYILEHSSYIQNHNVTDSMYIELTSLRLLQEIFRLQKLGKRTLYEEELYSKYLHSYRELIKYINRDPASDNTSHDVRPIRRIEKGKISTKRSNPLFKRIESEQLGYNGMYPLSTLDKDIRPISRIKK